MPIAIIKNSLYALTVLGQMVLVALLLGYLASRLFKGFRPVFKEWIRRSFSDRDALLAFLVALMATTGSLFYSEVANYTPCVLCWYQRIAMYPLLIILGLELTRKEVRTRLHAMFLAAIGGCIAGYQYLLQLGMIPPPPCTANAATSCAQKFTMGFGYITIPLMAFTAFALIIVFLGIGYSISEKKEK